MTETAPAYGPQTDVHLDLADQIVDLTERLDAYLTRPDCDPAVCEMLTLAIDIIDGLLAEEKTMPDRRRDID